MPTSPMRCACASPAAPKTCARRCAIGNEVETLYTNGPAGGGGAWKSARDVVAVASVLLPRELAKPQVHFVEA